MSEKRAGKRTDAVVTPSSRPEIQTIRDMAEFISQKYGISKEEIARVIVGEKAAET
jgi:hypothetical protein